MFEIINIILSGGSESQLYPLSRNSEPRQFLPIFDGRCLFEMTITRNQMISNHFIDVGNLDQSDLSRQCFANAHQKNYQQILEAAPSNTAAAIAFPCFDLPAEQLVLVTPSNHIIKNTPSYVKAIKQGIAFAMDGNLVCFGVQLNRPETGYAYIEFDGFDVKSFIEKPSEVISKTYIERGNFLRNINIFCFKAGVYLAELEKYEPEIYSKAKLAWENAENGSLPLAESLDIPSKSVDCAVMHKSEKIKVIPSDFFWLDIGSFDSIWDF